MNQILSKRKSWQASLTALLLIGVSQWIFVTQASAKQIQCKAQEDQNNGYTKIRSVTLHVIGESFRGVQYSKQITVTYVDSQYTLSYSCFRCKCPKVEGKKLEPKIAEEFLKLIESLEDGGSIAACCDHPYTEVEILYANKSTRKITLGFDLGKGGMHKEREIPGVEKVLNLECDGTHPTANRVSVESALKASLNSGKVPPDIIITYDDMHGLWGGTTMIIHGSGRGERRERARGDAEPKVFESALQQKQLFELIKLLIELKAWEQQTPDRPPVPDESRATLTISLEGQTSSIWEWFNEMEKTNRLIQIKAKMSKMTRSNQ